MKFSIYNFSIKRGGFTLVETLVAISIFSIAILGLMSVLSEGLQNTNYAKEKLIASYLAQEGIEIIRNMRDNYVLYGSGNPWNSFRSKLASCNIGNECGIDRTVPYTDSAFITNCPAGGCKLLLDLGYYNSYGGVDSGFVRKIWMIPVGNGNDQVKIYSDISWVQRSGSHNITFEEDLYNWTQ